MSFNLKTVQLNLHCAILESKSYWLIKQQNIEPLMEAQQLLTMSFRSRLVCERLKT